MSTKKEWLELRAEVEKLLSLLKEPEPGCFTWCDMYAKQMQKIADMWNMERKV